MSQPPTRFIPTGQSIDPETIEQFSKRRTSLGSGRVGVDLDEIFLEAMIFEIDLELEEVFEARMRGEFSHADLISKIATSGGYWQDSGKYLEEVLHDSKIEGSLCPHFPDMFKETDRGEIAWHRCGTSVRDRFNSGKKADESISDTVLRCIREDIVEYRSKNRSGIKIESTEG